MGRDSEMVTIFRPRREASEESNPVGPLDVALQAFRTVRKRISLVSVSQCVVFHDGRLSD